MYPTNTQRRRRRLLAASVAGLALLAACSDDDSAVDTGSTAPVAAEPDTSIAEDDGAESGTPTSVDSTGSTDDAAEEEGEDGEGDGGGEGSDNPAESVALELSLEGVTVQEVDLDDDEDEFVLYCFGDDVQEVSDETGFVLQGFDANNQVASTSAQLFEQDTSCVLAGFEAGTDLGAYTIGVARNSAVTDVSTEVNIQDSAPLEGSAENVGVSTSAPELLEATTDETLNQVSFQFDEELNEETEPDAASFGFYTAEGTLTTGSEVVTVEGRMAEISFDESAGDMAEEAVRFFVLPGAIQDRQEQENIYGSLGEATSVPDLVRVTRAEGTTAQFDFEFDDDVSDQDPARFLVYTEDAEAFEGTAFSTTGPTTVRVTVPEVEDFSNQVVKGAVAQDAATSNDSETLSNSVGALPIEGVVPRAGATTGPDLLSTELEVEAAQVTFTFDEVLDDDEGEASIRLESFFIVTESGDVAAARDFVEVTGNRVVVLFDESDAEAAAAFSVSAEAAVDMQGVPNPTATVPRDA